MFSLKTKIRTKFGRKTNLLRKQGVLPAILYGPEIKNIPLEISEKEFEKVFQKAGESSFILLETERKNYEVLIHEIKRDPLTEKILHVDLYYPSRAEKVNIVIPLVFENEEEAQKTLTGTLLKEFWNLEIKSLPQNLPKEIKVDLSKLKNVGDKIQIKDLEIPVGVEVLKNPEEIVVLVVPFEEFEELKEEKRKEESISQKKLEEKK